VVRPVSLEDANAALPALRPLVATAMKIHGQLRPLIAQLEVRDVEVDRKLLLGAIPKDAGRTTRFMIGRVQGLYGALREIIDEIEGHGAQVKDLETGLLDFRSYLGGEREVLLCWRIDESVVGHYHDLSAGFAGRRPVAGCTFTATPSHPGREHA